MRFILLFLLSLVWTGVIAQTDSPIASLQWSKDSTVVGGQAELILSLDGINEEPGEWYWDTTVVVPMDTTLKGEALDTLWEMSAEPYWYSNNPGQWQCRMPFQFWNAGLFFYGGLHIMSADNDKVIHHQEDVQTAIYVYYPTSIRQSQEIRPLRDIIPARHSHSESWIRLLWPGFLWTLICLFIPLLLGRRKNRLNKIDRVLISAKRWWEETKRSDRDSSEANKEQYAALSRRLRYWMEEKLNIPAKEWTTAQLDHFALNNDTIDPEQIAFLHRVDAVVYGYSSLPIKEFKADQDRVDKWTRNYAESLDTLSRSRAEVEPILPHLVYEQSVEKISLGDGLSRVLATFIDILLYLLPLSFITLLSGCLPYLSVLKDSYGFAVLSLILICVVSLLYVMVDAFWHFYRSATPGNDFMHLRAVLYPDHPWTYLRFLKRSFIKLLTTPLTLIRVREKGIRLVQDEQTHIYKEDRRR